MRIGNLNLVKPWGVVVTTGGKTVLKQFETEPEAMDFGKQLGKFANVQFEIVEKKSKGIDGRADSIAFVEMKAGNVPGGVYYQCVPVRPMKGYLFCTECHDYKKFKDATDGFGLTLHCCPDCGTAKDDFYVKTANNLWGSFRP